MDIQGYRCIFNRTQALFFCKTLHFKCLTVFRIHVILNNCSVICTMTLCCVLHQTHSKFWHIQNSIYSGIFRHIQAYLALLMHIQALRHIHAYSSIFITLRNPRTFTTLPFSEPWHILNRGHIQSPVKL